MFRPLLVFLCIASTAQAGGYRYSYCNTCYVKPVTYTYAAPKPANYNSNFYTYNYDLRQFPAPQGNVVANAVFSGDSYAATDLSAVAIAQAQFQSAGLRSIDNGWSTIRDGNAGLNAFMLQADAGKNRVYETLAKAELLRAAAPAPTAAFSYQSNSGYNSPPSYNPNYGQPPAPPTYGQGNPATNDKIVATEQRCAVCHANQEMVAAKQSKSVIPRFSELTAQQAQSVKNRLITHNPELVMPKGQPLPDDELQAVMLLLDRKIYGGQ